METVHTCGNSKLNGVGGRRQTRKPISTPCKKQYRTYHFWGNYHVPTTWLTLPLFNLRHDYVSVAQYPHFHDGKFKVQQGWVTYSKSHRMSTNELGLCQPRALASSTRSHCLHHWFSNNGTAVFTMLTAHPGSVGQRWDGLGNCELPLPDPQAL